MSPAELSAMFPLYAGRCIEIAQELPNPHRGAAILNMAQAWLVLAERVEKNSGVVVGVSLMPGASHEETDK